MCGLWFQGLMPAWMNRETWLSTDGDRRLAVWVAGEDSLPLGYSRIWERSREKCPMRVLAQEFKNFEDLAAAHIEGTDYRIHMQRRPGSPIAVIAPHGGRIGPHTSAIAREVAGTDFNFYLFEGIRHQGNYAAWKVLLGCRCVQYRVSRGVGNYHLHPE